MKSMRHSPDHLTRLRRRLRRPEPPPVTGVRRQPPTSGTAIEVITAGLLTDLGVAFVAQHRLLPGVTVDFYVPSAYLAVECQGTWYHADPLRYGDDALTAAQRRKRRHDAALQHYAERAGLVVLELWEQDLCRQPEVCRERLRAALHRSATTDG